MTSHDVRRDQLTHTLVTRGIAALLRRDFDDVRLAAEALGEHHGRGTTGALLLSAAALLERLPPTPRAWGLAARTLGLIAPDQGTLFRVCASRPVGTVIERLVDESRKPNRAVAILGAGRHTQWLLASTPLLRARPRAVLVSAGASASSTFCNLPVHDLPYAERLGITHVLVSFPEPPRKLAAQLAELEARGLVLVRPFAELPRNLIGSRIPSTRLEPAPSPEGTGDCPLVAYLARKAEGLEPFERFLASYRSMSEPLRHQLLIIYKGFDGAGETAPYQSHLEGVAHLHTHVPDVGFDLGAYFEVFRRFRYPSYLFLGSFCVLQTPSWLTALDRALREHPDAGIAAASGSWAVGITHLFPNAHVRTSAFLVRECVLRQIRVDRIHTKLDAYEIEQGLHSLTRQVQALGMCPYIVGKDGRAFAPEEWPQSRTFYAGDQDNLLVSDNRTEMYQAGDPKTRRLLAEEAWGPFPVPDIGFAQTSSKLPS